MTEVLLFGLRFHTPFRVGTGSASSGADSSIDRAVPVPGSSIKGVMRAAARDVLGGLGPQQDGGDHPLVVEVFGDEEGVIAGPRSGLGTRGDGSPWHWDDVRLDPPPGAPSGPDAVTPVLRTRIRVDPDSRVVARGALLVAEELFPTTGTMEIWRSGTVPPERLAVHRALLAVTARLVDGVGAGRRSGTGWASLVPDPGWEPAREDCVRLLIEERNS
jgi:hypothetical protein